MTEQIERLMSQTGSLESLDRAAPKQGEEAEADAHFPEAFGLAHRAAHRVTDGGWHPTRLDTLRIAVRFALERGGAAEARRLMAEALSIDASIRFSDEWVQLHDVRAWPDRWLIASVRSDPPDIQALDELANRYWKPLFDRCQFLTLDHQKAGDLTQEACRRVSRNRRALKPGGNFPAYLTTIATNLWRDCYRSAERAGPMADHRLESLEAAHPHEGAETLRVMDRISDLRVLSPADHTLLAMDIDYALGRLAPRLREVLVARFITGESCAEIGRRYGRTEQSISGWVRRALRQMKLHLETPGDGTVVNA